MEKHTKHYKMLLKEKDNHRIQSEEGVSDRQLHEGMALMADKIATRFELEFYEEMRKEKS